MKKFASLAALVVLPVLGVLFSTPVFADSPGHLAGGDLYQVRNVTKNTNFGNVADATCNETVKFQFKLSNTEYGMLYGVSVYADLANDIAGAAAQNSANEEVSMTDTVSLTIPSNSTISYVNGSAQLYDVNGKLIRALPDGITNDGIEIGNLAGSTREYVQFQAKVNCPETPKKIQVCELATKKIITIDEKDFDATKHSKNPDDCKEVVKKIKVCELATKKVIEINEKDFDAAKHSKTLSDCAEKPPVPGEITVCRISDKKIVNIKENEFDNAKYTKDLSKCAATPVTPPVTPTTPTELPQTGATGLIGLVVTVLTAGIGYAVTARKNVLG